MGEYKMPSLGADMKDATLIAWKVEPGDRVSRGDIIGEITTEKGDIDIEVFQDGVIEELVVRPGEKVPVGTVMARIRSEGGERGSVETDGDRTAAGMEVVPPPAAGEPSEETEPAVPEQGAAEEPAARPPRPATDGHRLRVSPLARRVAEELGVNLQTVTGTGPDGAIKRADVERAAAEKAVEAPELPVEAPASSAGSDTEAMRQAIAAAMSRSNRDIPHYYLETNIDMQPALAWLSAANQERSIQERLLPAVLLIKAVAHGLTEVPELNGYWKDGRHQPQESIHIGFAISLRRGGLIAPGIHHADQMTVDELMVAVDDLVTRAREGRLRSSELTDPTITVTNLGDRGVETVYGVIYPPQVALVGFGKITERPWAEGGMLDVRPVLTATLAADHRATDGRQGARFLEYLTHYLQNPSEL